MDRITKSSIRDYGVTIVAAAFVALMLRAFIIEAYRIPTSAMRPSLEPGDTIFVSKWPYRLWNRTPEPGEVVLFAGEDGREYIKRVVASAGDTLEIKNGRILVNGKALGNEGLVSTGCGKEQLPQGRSYGVCWEAPMIADLPSRTVPQDSVFVIGDLRTSGSPEAGAAARRSVGSAQAGWGIVPVQRIKGKAVWIWLSIGSRSTTYGDGGASHWLPRFRFARMFRRIE